MAEEKLWLLRCQIGPVKWLNIMGVVTFASFITSHLCFLWSLIESRNKSLCINIEGHLTVWWMTGTVNQSMRQVLHELNRLKGAIKSWERQSFVPNGLLHPDAGLSIPNSGKIPLVAQPCLANPQNRPRDPTLPQNGLSQPNFTLLMAFRSDANSIHARSEGQLPPH